MENLSRRTFVGAMGATGTALVAANVMGVTAARANAEEAPVPSDAPWAVSDRKSVV